MTESKHPIFRTMKCHHWNGDLLVKEKGCRHKLPMRFAAKTLSMEPNWIKGIKKHKGTKGFVTTVEPKDSPLSDVFAMDANRLIFSDLYQRVEHVLFGNSIVRKTAKNKKQLIKAIQFEMGTSLGRVERLIKFMKL